MKKVLVLFACALLGATALLSQTTEKPGAKSAGLGKQSTTSNEEMNIRAYIELLRADVRKTKTEIVAEVMSLDAEQATKFWPIYKEFETEYQALGDRIATMVLKYAEGFDKITDALADQVANEVLTIEDRRQALKKQYYDRFKQSLGAITAARFLQVENQLERIIDLQISAQLPVIGDR
jgi:hypothetical protein